MEAADRTLDYLILRVASGAPSTAVLELDDREKPDLHERLWLPDKSADTPVGYRLVKGEVIEAKATSITIVLDSPITLQSQSGSPVLSQRTGKVIGTLSSYKLATDGPLRLILCPAHAIREALAQEGTYPPVSRVIGGR
jgi:hypothetical protein